MNRHRSIFSHSCFLFQILIRRLSGDVSWMCRIQNSSLVSDSHGEFPLADLTALFQPTKDSEVRAQISAKLDQAKRVPLEELGEQTGKDAMEQVRRTRRMGLEPVVHFVIRCFQKPEAPPETAKETSEPPPTSEPAQSCGPIEEAEEQPSEPTLSASGGSVTLRRKLSSASPQHRRPSLQPQQSHPSTSPSKSVSQSPRRGNTPPSVAAQGSSGGLLTNPLGAKPRPMVTQEAPGPGKRDRAHTISGPSPRRMPQSGLARRSGPDLLRANPSTSASSSSSSSAATERAERVTGVSPQFVFLQLYHQCMFGDVKDLGKPLLLPANSAIEASIRNLDRIPAHETHKIGVLYIGRGQEDDEAAILLNEFGSIRYTHFLHGLGSLISLQVRGN